MATANFIIRQAKSADLAELSDLAKSTYVEAFGTTYTRSQLDQIIAETRSEKYFESVLGEDGIMIALKNNKIVGYVQFGAIRRPFKNTIYTDRELSRLYIDSKHQGQGIGKALLESALSDPGMKQASSIYLDVWSQNAKAINLYKKYGFIIVDDIEWHMDGKYLGTDLVMRREQ